MLYYLSWLVAERAARRSAALVKPRLGPVRPRLCSCLPSGFDRQSAAAKATTALKEAGVPVEMHLYAQGGHASGLRRTKFPITAWPQLVEKWLGTIGMLAK
jgi:hypothetical protein